MISYYGPHQNGKIGVSPYITDLYTYIRIMPVPEQQPVDHHRHDGVTEDASQEANFTVKPLAHLSTLSGRALNAQGLDLQHFAALPSGSTYTWHKMNEMCVF